MAFKLYYKNQGRFVSILFISPIITCYICHKSRVNVAIIVLFKSNLTCSIQPKTHFTMLMIMSGNIGMALHEKFSYFKYYLDRVLSVADRK